MISAKTSVEEILERNPEMAQIFLRWGLPCLTCGEPFWGTLEELAKQSHFDKLEELIADLNK